MKRSAVSLALVAMLSAMPLSAAQDSAEAGDSELSENEARLARLIGDRVAGEPQSCLPLRGLRHMNIVEDTAIVFDYGATVYVNVPADPQLLRENDRLVSQRTHGRLCNNDFLRTEDRFQGFATGNVFLRDFVPYTRPD